MADTQGDAVAVQRTDRVLIEPERGILIAGPVQASILEWIDASA